MRRSGPRFAGAARILADSELVALHLPNYTGPKLTTEQLQAKTHVVYHNLQRSFLAAAQAPDLGPEPGRVLFLGALNEKKGALVFLEAIAEIDSSAGATFALIGGTTEKNAAFDRKWATQLESVRAHGVPLELPGQLSAPNVIAQIRRASVGGASVALRRVFARRGRGARARPARGDN